jgi:hypothetical protein
LKQKEKLNSVTRYLPRKKKDKLCCTFCLHVTPLHFSFSFVLIAFAC